MNHAIRRIGVGVVILFLVIVGQLTYLQVVDAKKLADDPRNSRTFLRDFTRPRGEIVSADGVVLAKSVPTPDEYQRQRVYPLGELTSQIVGYQSVVVGSTGVERSYNAVLAGRDVRNLKISNLGDLLLGKDRTGTVVLSLRVDAQLLAKQALGNQIGSVLALDPRTGSIIAMYSNPSFDPGPLAAHNPKAVQAAFAALVRDPANPALPRSYRERYPPGSTFKVVTTEAALDTGVATTSTPFPVVTQIPLPLSTNTLSNFGNKACGGTLEDSFRESCNTTFARLGLELGDRFPPRMAGFGIYDAPPLDLRPGASASTGPPLGSFQRNQPDFALAGIGQGKDLAVTPLQMALVASAVANGGTVMSPHVAGEIRDQDGKTVRTVAPRVWKHAMPPSTAATITQLMLEVVKNGTGTAAQIPGVAVAGKTGTAQTCQGCRPHAWFIAFAPADAPRFAVAVIVERGGNLGDEATGGRVAAPVAAKMLRSLLAQPPSG